MEKMRQFYLWTDGLIYKDWLSPFIESGYITPNCVTSRSNLSNKLKRLLELGLIYKDQRGHKDRYKINRECRLKGIKFTHLNWINEFKNLYAYKDRGLVYGLSTDMFYKFNEADRSDILAHLRVINDSLNEIKEIKDAHIFREWINMNDPKDIKDVVRVFFDANLQKSKELSELTTKLQELYEEYEYKQGIAFSWSVNKPPNPLKEPNPKSI
jgi:hypothetical protein